ncbi:hypothetical protein CKR_1975 [Clostridium kluyveri NBRC 12016]|uniref:Uncharacterized protein n=1 Tax=Clostridium kluyveri (strain NBRC 12016) TaxID=583346 RepID=B9E3F1_CLOK1|nr:hypothetical protein CKR_1975 [Clostridium kluyveri NBRC 12016]
MNFFLYWEGVHLNRILKCLLKYLVCENPTSSDISDIFLSVSKRIFNASSTLVKLSKSVKLYPVVLFAVNTMGFIYIYYFYILLHQFILI